MRKPMLRYAAAVLVIAMVVLGLFEFIGPDAGSGVVWAEVTRKVQASKGLIYRSTEKNSESLEGQDAPEYSINYMTPKQSRSDAYKAGKIVRSFYRDYDAMIGHAVFNTAKRYIREPLKEADTHKHKELTNPKWLLQTILSCQHKELGKKIIEGKLYEGIETTDPAFFGENLPFPAADIDARLELWVSVETNYPVLFAGSMTNKHEGRVMSSQFRLDQFQWDTELDTNTFEPNIPSDYEKIGKF